MGLQRYLVKRLILIGLLCYNIVVPALLRHQALGIADVRYHLEGIYALFLFCNLYKIVQMKKPPGGG